MQSLNILYLQTKSEIAPLPVGLRISSLSDLGPPELKGAAMFNLEHIAKIFTGWGRNSAASPSSQITGACEGEHQAHCDVLMLHLVPGLDLRQRRAVCRAVAHDLRQRLGGKFSVLKVDAAGNCLAVEKGHRVAALALLNSPSFQNLSFASALRTEIFMEEVFAAVHKVSAGSINGRECVQLRFDSVKMPPDPEQRADFMNKGIAAVRQLCDFRSVSIHRLGDSLLVMPKPGYQYTPLPLELLTVLTAVVREAHEIHPCSRPIVEQWDLRK